MNRNTNPLTKQAKAIIILLVALTGSAIAQQSLRTTELAPTGKGWGVAQEGPETYTTLGPAVTTNGITYHGGPVMSGNVNVYFIWYGNWSNGKAKSDSQVTTALISELYGNTGGVAGTGLAQIMSTYHDSKAHVASSNMSVVKSTTDNYSHGKSLSDAAVQSVVNNAIATGKLPKDSNGIYFVLSSSDVDETSGLCKNYCGWHNHADLLKSDIKFAFVGNPDRCPLTCEVQAQTPNGDSGADAMATVMVHETFETIADPDLNAWYDAKGQEIGDKCAWKWGPVEGMFGYGAYNQSFRNRNWLIQMIWENANGGGCAQDKGGKFYNQ